MRVQSVSYTSITKRTFNLNIHVHSGAPTAGDDDGVETGGDEVEFAMIDQADYTGIDAYIRKHRLNDASMAEMRRAVVYNINKNKADKDTDGTATTTTITTTTTGADAAAEGTSISDLQKALEQAEDEEEGEDYDPENEDSESGSEDDEDEDSDDDEDEGDDESDGGDGDINLKDELGSELEQVTPDEDGDQEMGGVARKIVGRRRNARR